MAAADMMTPQDFRAVWGGALTAQTGRYKISGNRLDIMPIAAKNPKNMGPGSESNWLFDLKGNTLSITERSGRTIRLRRAE
jgi:hypothetical protein